MKKNKNKSQRTYALVASIALILMAIVAGVSYGYIHNSLVSIEYPAKTLENIRSSTGLFKLEVIGWITIFLLDALVAWSLYRFFASTSKSLAFLSSFLRILYTAVLGVAIYQLPKVLQKINRDLSGAGEDTVTAEVIGFLNSFENLWSHGLIIFGPHLVVLGYLAFRADYVPKIWGVLLALAGLSYIYVHTMQALNPGMADHLKTLESILAIPMTIGELGFAFWLLFRGGRKRK